jgi:hypothetical protein
MNIIHAAKTLARLVDDALAARLRVMPAAVLTVARQTGKSTLVEQLVPGERRYRSLDDFDVRDAARRDPKTLLGGDDPLTLDEIQREPGRLTAGKRGIDRDRRSGLWRVNLDERRPRTSVVKKVFLHRKPWREPRRSRLRATITRMGPAADRLAAVGDERDGRCAIAEANREPRGTRDTAPVSCRCCIAGRRGTRYGRRGRFRRHVGSSG